jgi:chromosomal replication initiator protein
MAAKRQEEVNDAIWQQCLGQLQSETNGDQFETYLRPLQVDFSKGKLTLLAPNIYVEEKVRSTYLTRISEYFAALSEESDVLLAVGGMREAQPLRAEPKQGLKHGENLVRTAHNLNREFTFDSFVEGKSNELAKAAASQVADNAGKSYNPLLMYGGVGLGKTHLMQAVGNEILRRKPDARVMYLHSQRFVQDMVKALQTGTMQDFMQFYRSVDALLIDDIQFFAKKLRSQEEFFHLFNALLEKGQQMILTSDKYPREIDGLEDRLKSRFVWGLTVEVEAPELETRVAILMKKAETEGVPLDQEVAFFIAERIR